MYQFQIQLNHKKMGNSGGSKEIVPVIIVFKGAKPDMFEIVTGVSNRHIHITQEHLEKLFGPGYCLTP